MAEVRENKRGETLCWNDVTVKTILRNEVYIGYMVQNKTGMVSYKNHKQISKPESEWIRAENTHEPLISQEVWDAVQRMDNHPVRGRSGKSGTIALFGGLLRCMDYGASMRYMQDYRKKVSEKAPEKGAKAYSAICCAVETVAENCGIIRTRLTKRFITLYAPTTGWIIVEAVPVGTISVWMQLNR